MIETVDAFLEHYGKKGMKWGVRTKRPSTSTKKTKYQKSPARLSDAQLKSRIDRLQNEKKYNELNSVSKTRGKKIADEILIGSGKAVATTLISGTAVFLGKKYLASKHGIKLK